LQVQTYLARFSVSNVPCGRAMTLANSLAASSCMSVLARSKDVKCKLHHKASPRSRCSLFMYVCMCVCGEQGVLEIKNDDDKSSMYHSV